jgi:hypothetical protein
VKKRLLICAKLMLIVLYMSYYGGTTLFTHTHQTPFGPVTHSHPFSHHGHTTAEFETINLLSAIIFYITPALIINFILLVFRNLLIQKTKEYTYTTKRLSSLRAPPAFIQFDSF